MGWQNRTSISNYMYNHLGMLAEGHHALAKSLFLGGVTRRFPDLQLRVPRGRGGVGGRRSTPTSSGTGRSATAPPCGRLDPARVDWDEFAELFARYGGEWARTGVPRR